MNKRGEKRGKSSFVSFFDHLLRLFFESYYEALECFSVRSTPMTNRQRVKNNVLTSLESTLAMLRDA